MSLMSRILNSHTSWRRNQSISLRTCMLTIMSALTVFSALRLLSSASIENTTRLDPDTVVQLKNTIVQLNSELQQLKKSLTTCQESLGNSPACDCSYMNSLIVDASNGRIAAKKYDHLLQSEMKAPACSTTEQAWKPDPLPNPPFRRLTVGGNSKSRVSGDDHQQINRWLTVAAHASGDRLSSLTQLCKYWDGLITVAIYDEDDTRVREWCDHDTVCNCADSDSRLVLKTVFYDQLSKDHNGLYPVNTLRNIALNSVDSTYALGLDVDFVIGGNLTKLQKPPENTLYVIPCFKVEKDERIEGEGWPMTKSSLIHWHNKGWVSAYGEMEGWPLGHMDANYTTWYTAEEKYTVDIANIYFEPYFIAQTDFLPLYDERYRGYGAGDKALHFHLMYKSGYKIEVLSDNFLLHLPHEDNAWRDGTGNKWKSYFQGFHGIDRMTLGVHQIDFWTRIASNCIESGCRQTYCSDLVPHLAGGQHKCQTYPERYTPGKD